MYYFLDIIPKKIGFGILGLDPDPNPKQKSI